MKRTLSFLLAILMVVSIVPLMGLVAGAEGETVVPTAKYVVYQEDFDALSASATKDQILSALGWYVPEAKANTDIADYTIVGSEVGGVVDQALRVSTLAPIGMNYDSFVTVFGGDVMSLVKNGNFTLSYELTYQQGTTNTDGYSALIYNYNEKHGPSISETSGEAYGLVAVRVCGTGLNNLYYPTGLGSSMMALENLTNTAANVMSNRYTVSGSYPSLYARLVDGAVEGEGDTRIGTDVMIDVPLNICIQYSYDDGITVLINDIVVSETNTTTNFNELHNTALWDDFTTRNDGAAIALVTKPGVVAEIDNIKIEAERVAQGTLDQDLPELVITEISPSPKDTYSWSGCKSQ